ncbi:type II toxin-antitoxin system mRNA interferase toxin, RelE/StbE family [Pseudidiomarina aquimaris]|uniref:Type II toxin-antitoxin system mRNA interferase toxin, RelE/StbE family n=1 Tax=Pseudidiomarina aquimaris TaxID=641841 RepID=A0A432XPF4_9GAMM|nr:type II toxin-antitoxin system RelE/ParE family toxin [Pseudidiomarina aquimaris]RUO50605.1 type II toxin-antitoxin system mRNA interferase toxin, RelE/StbE family [Pseudidiomarina aquimaris]
MIYWEKDALNDRFEFYRFIHAENPLAAERADTYLTEAIQRLERFPELGVQRQNLPGRLLVLPTLSLLVLYTADVTAQATTIYVLRVLHQRQHPPLE